MHIRGFVLNLAHASERRKRIGRHLASLTLPGRYQFVEAIKGSSDHSQRGQLSRGEDGLWRSCLALLKKACSAPEPFDCIHLLEDDAVLSQEFCAWATKTQIGDVADNAVIFTDMFIEATLFAQLQPEAAKAFAKPEIKMLAGHHYSGCTASWLVPRPQLQHLLNTLEQAYQKPAHEKLPLDISILKCLQAGDLEGAITFPFLSSIHLKDQHQSSIQDQRQPVIAASSCYNALLRRRLSFCREDADYSELGNLLYNLLKGERMDNFLAHLSLELQSRKAFRYIHDPRLLHLPHNPQAEGLG